MQKRALKLGRNHGMNQAREGNDDGGRIKDSSPDDIR